jgi:hypothetical protein
VKRFSTRRRVLKREYTDYGEFHPKSGYCRDQSTDYILYWQLLFGEHVIFQWELDRETLPSYVWIYQGCFGCSPCSWRSKFDDIINQQKENAL